MPQEPTALPAFRRQRLSDVFYCEGASFGDLDGDGHGDVVSGPYWYAGPDFAERREIYAPKPFDPLHHSGSFFAWTRDFDGDGRLDLLQVGFPGKEAFWYRNPGGEEQHWERFLVTSTADNESPAYTDLVGDAAPELVCRQGGRHGWLAPNPEDPRAEWSFHALSPDLGLQRSTHGLGVGGVYGDGRMAVLERTGWWEQPDELAGDPEWSFHPVDFCAGRHGGAQMYAYDVDGDNDVITSLAAHAWGLSWFELVREGVGARYEPHRIDADSGVGTQVTVGDVDRRVDVVVGNELGTFVFLQDDAARG